MTALKECHAFLYVSIIKQTENPGDVIKTGFSGGKECRHLAGMMNAIGVAFRKAIH